MSNSQPVRSQSHSAAIILNRMMSTTSATVNTSNYAGPAHRSTSAGGELEQSTSDANVANLPRSWRTNAMAMEFVSKGGMDQERLYRIQLLQQHLQEQSAKIDQGEATSLDLEAVQQHMNEVQWKKSMVERFELGREKGLAYTYSYLRLVLQRSGLKHLLLVVILIAYSMLGGFIFMKLEWPNEVEQAKTVRENALRENAYAVFSTLNKFRARLTSLCTNSSREVGLVESEDLLVEFYMEMLDAEGGESVLLKLKRPDLYHTHDAEIIWTFKHATFYAMTLFTTIGYGTIAASTHIGQAVTVLYSVIGIPLMLVVVGDLGKVLFLMLQKIYNWTLGLCSSNRRKVTSTDETAAIELRPFPFWLSIVLFYCYLMIVTVLVYNFDEVIGPSDVHGLNFGHSFYFAYISITTIGLGDVMPRNIHYSPMTATLFLFGLALLGVINTASLSGIQRNYFQAVGALESVLHQMELDKREKHIMRKRDGRSKTSSVSVSSTSAIKPITGKRVSRSADQVPRSTIIEDPGCNMPAGVGVVDKPTPAASSSTTR